ncbi:unnamed protein product [Nippostrongylus brasiliensis]|uniref:Serpentine receptor class gamma n=1 Tax=Nippostrongylus brasiliensis TaxID=27835 RepID=A0A0N4XY50_NIPBR|nr:unnamed protein product [Nippostrongylus brasiliensis]
MRATKWLTPIYWNLQNYYIATWCFNQYYIATVLRTLGITLITTHRYMTMCQHGSVWERWVFPFVYVMPALGRKLLFFDNEHGMNVVAGHDLITIGNVLAVGFLCPSFTVCLLCYMAILRFLYKHRLDNTISFKRELRVCVQMIGMVVAFALCTLYHVLLFKFSLSADLLLIFKTRQQYPLMTCFLSYISPWMMPSPQLSRFREISNSKITPICISRR